jgi:hypothetical protein
MKALLANEFAPVTLTLGFVECPFTEFSEAFTRWQKGLDAQFGTQTEVCRFRAPLSEAILKLEPLVTPSDRYLLIETRSGWSAIFSNGLRVNDVNSPVSYLPTVLKCRGLEVFCIPDRSDKNFKDALQIYGAVVFTLYGSEKTDFLNRIRHIGVTHDVSGWEFMAQGEIQPFEKTENYQRRKVADRFTDEMLESYCEALGIKVFDANFYGGECLVSHITKRAVPSDLTMSISEARSHLFI